MGKTVKVGIIICDRYRNCAEGKCFKDSKNREIAFSECKEKGVEVAGYTTYGGCPGENIEYAPEEVKKNSGTANHFTTEIVAGYLLCPYADYFKKYIKEKFGLKVIAGIHPIPEKYYIMNKKLGTRDSSEWKELIKSTLCNKKIDFPLTEEISKLGLDKALYKFIL